MGFVEISLHSPLTSLGIWTSFCLHCRTRVERVSGGKWNTLQERAKVLWPSWRTSKLSLALLIGEEGAGFAQ